MMPIYESIGPSSSADANIQKPEHNYENIKNTR